MKGWRKMEKYLSVVKLTIGEETKTFLVGQNNITKEEIERVYKSYCKEDGKKYTMQEFLKEIEQYGIELKDISDNVITHIVL
jgi:hypothetical protein